MKKRILLLITAIIMVTLVSCSKGKKVTVAVSVTPHSEVLEFIKPKMKEKGYDLEIMIVKDVVTANMALKEDSIDANYIQHRGTLERFNKEQNANFVEVTGVHLEPFGMYSKKVKNAADLPQNAEIILPNSPANQGRAFKLLSDAGVLKFKDGVKVETTTLQEFDKVIAANPKNLKFKAVQPSLLPQLYTQGEGDAIFINANFAIQAKLNPLKDAILVEDVKNSSRYVNILVTKKGKESDEGIKILAELLRSAETKKFIEDKYKGQVIPAN